MKYRIALEKSEEGYSVSVPGLPGCWSQGDTEAEAIENIRDAIISRNVQFCCPYIFLTSHFIPPGAYALCSKACRVRADANVDISLIASHIIDTVGSGFPQFR